MPNFAGALKGEIRRLARKEVRESVTPLRKVVAALRRRVAQQRKQLSELERSSKRSVRNGSAGEAPASDKSQIRFSPTWVKTHRKKLNMSRRVYAKLIGVSAQSIFGWEAGRSRPRRSALEVWRQIRGMGRRELQALQGAAKPKRGRRAKPAKSGRKAERGRPAKGRVAKRGRPAKRRAAAPRVAGRGRRGRPKARRVAKKK